MVVVDTVGFISSLPTQLVAAFHSTLEEILYADVSHSPYSDLIADRISSFHSPIEFLFCAQVLLHVRDASSADFEQQKESVLRVLRE